MVEGGMSCIKYILFVFNFIFVVFGGLLVYFGVIIIQDNQSWTDLFETPNTLAISVIVLGFLIFLVAFLGCCGAIVESHCILLTFGIVVTVILLLELAIGGLAFAFKAELRTATSGVVSKYNWTDPKARYSVLIDHVQSSFKCCGFNSSTDWRDINPNPADRNLLPESCCSKEPGGLGPNSCRLPDSLPFQPLPYPGHSGVRPTESPSSTSSRLQSSSYKPHTSNCVDVFSHIMYANVGPLGLALLAVALFQLLGIVFAFSLSRAVKREYQVV